MTAVQEQSVTDIPGYCEQIADRAVAASRSLAGISGARRAAALENVAKHIRAMSNAIQAANAKDLAAAKNNGLTDAMIDRLRIDDTAIAKIAKSVEQIAAQIDPVGQIIEGRVLPNGIRLEKVRAPIGVVLIIYESRPNVTSDAAALCIKSGNAVILRGGKEARHSNLALAACVREGLAEAGLPLDAVQLVEIADRTAIGHLLKMVGRIDLAIPRGGESLIRAVVEQAHIPVIKHYTGNCHVYVDASCDADMALNICINAKTQRLGVCNAAETFILHAETIQNGLARRILTAMDEHGVEVRGDESICALHDAARPATDADWGTEYLDRIVAVRIADDIDQAIDHINRYGSKHTDAIITDDIATADRFVQLVDSANAFVNCSTRFSDGGEYGLGAEIGISTDKLHARGPMGAADLTTYKWIARGNGQIRT